MVIVEWRSLPAWQVFLFQEQIALGLHDCLEEPRTWSISLVPKDIPPN